MSETDQIQRTAEAAGKWWAERLSEAHADKRHQFADEIAKLVEGALREHPDFPAFLECDYDPQGLLLEAVRASGIECRGFMFSADGVLPRKHNLTVKIGRLEPKEGYGRWTDAIEVQ